MKDLAKRNKSRPGGYTRILKLGARVGDASPKAIIEFVEKPAKEDKKEESKEKKSAKKSSK
jgi:large subunit ribosomal protein L17